MNANALLVTASERVSTTDFAPGVEPRVVQVTCVALKPDTSHVTPEIDTLGAAAPK